MPVSAPTSTSRAIAEPPDRPGHLWRQNKLVVVLVAAGAAVSRAAGADEDQYSDGLVIVLEITIKRIFAGR